MIYNPVRRWYDQNRNKLWAVVLVVGMVLFFIYIMNSFYKKEINENPPTTTSNVVSMKENINNEITGQLDSTTSLISGTGVDTTQLKKDTKIIDEFIKKCNEEKTQEAYDMLSNECKEEVFPTLASFETKYYNNVFKSAKTYSIQNWNKRIYKVKIIDDALSTGKVSNNDTHLQEYMTIVYTDNGSKLNINNYVGRKVANKTSKKDVVEVTFVKKETFMSYEEYTIKVKNISENEVVLDSGEQTDTIYLLDGNNIKEYANTGEINYETLKLLPGVTREYTFRFSNGYSSSRVMEYLVFEKAIVNNDDDSTDKKYQRISIGV